MILLLAKTDCQHVALIESSLKKNKAEYFLLKTKLLQDSIFIEYELKNSIITGCIRTPNKCIDLLQIKSIWWFDIDITFNDKDNIHSDYVSFAQQETYSLCKTIFSSLDVYHVNHPSQVVAASNKFSQLKLANSLGFNTPNTLVSSDSSRIIEFQRDNSKIIYKTLSHPTLMEGKRELVIYTNEVSSDDLKDEESLRVSMNLFQCNIKKNTELRITVVGEDVFACEIHSQQSNLTKTDWRVYDLANVPHNPVNIDREMQDKCIELTKSLNLEYSTIDLIVDDNNQYWFLEVNPNGLWAWIQLLTDLKISDAFAKLLILGNQD